MGAGWSPGKAGKALACGGRRTPPPTADTVWTKLRIVPYLPTALRLDQRWQRGVPNAWPAVGAFLRDLTGHDFPLLSRLRHKRVVRSVAAMLRENLDPATTVVGLDVKVLAGIVYAEVVADRTLGADVRALAPRNGVTETRLDAAIRFAAHRHAADAAPGRDPKVRAALRLAQAASPSPAEIDGDVVAACREGGLSAPAVIELVSWIAVLQMLHRLSCYLAVE
jgi:alkylhydroperoxidase family enzyme